MGVIVFVILIIGLIVIAVYLVDYFEKLQAERIRLFEARLVELIADPINPEKQALILDPQFMGLPHECSARAYSVALAILSDHPDSCNARTFALAIGRWHLGRIRPDGKCSIYDEQAMQNDILVRSQMSAATLKQSLAVAEPVQ